MIYGLELIGLRGRRRRSYVIDRDYCAVAAPKPSAPSRGSPCPPVPAKRKFSGNLNAQRGVIRFGDELIARVRAAGAVSRHDCALLGGQRGEMHTVLAAA